MKKLSFFKLIFYLKASLHYAKYLKDDIIDFLSSDISVTDFKA